MNGSSVESCWSSDADPFGGLSIPASWTARTPRVCRQAGDDDEWTKHLQRDTIAEFVELVNRDRLSCNEKNALPN
jgi:hypothetical protein